MKAEQRTVFIAEDGTEFDSEWGCRLHESRGVLAGYLANSTLCLDGVETIDAAAFIIENFDEIARVVGKPAVDARCKEMLRVLVVRLGILTRNSPVFAEAIEAELTAARGLLAE